MLRHQKIERDLSTLCAPLALLFDAIKSHIPTCGIA
jgi:hypothetical protein